MQNFGYITNYPVSDSFEFGKNNNIIELRFNDGSTAIIQGIFKFRMPSKENSQLKIHRDFRSYENFKEQLIKQTVREALLQSSPFFNSTEVYTSKRAELSQLAEQQLTMGLFDTTTKSIKEIDVAGGEFIKNIITINKLEDGSFKVRKKSPFSEYDVEIIQFAITDITFDKFVEDAIAKKKATEQEKMIALANAEKSKQDAITIVEQGKAKIATAEAEALILQKTAVINAEKERKVAEENAKKAIADAKAIIELGKAEAESNRLKVQAGLTPLEKATIEKETAIGVAEQLSKIKFPELLIIGGDGKNNLNPFDAIGLESFKRISKEISNNK